MRNKRQGRPAGKKKGAPGGSKGHGGGKGSSGATAATTAAQKGQKRRRKEEDDEDDEDIDEDMAFDEEDERKYGELLREIAMNDESQRSRGDGDDDDEDDADDDEEEDEEEGTMLLSDLLEGGGKGSSSSGKQKQEAQGKRVAVNKMDEEEEEEDDDDAMDEGSEEEEDDDGDEEEEEEEDEEDATGGDHEGLMQMIDRLAGSKGGGDDVSSSFLNELQNMPDSAFATKAAQGLTLEAMLDSLQDTRGIAAVRKQLGNLANSSAVSAPAPTAVQERAERQVAYGEKRKAVAEWLPLVSAARQADTLNFSYEPRQVLSQAELVGKFEAETEMEVAIRDLLTHAKADKEAKIEEGETEALVAKGLTLEQVKSRQAELAKMRALLLYEQQRRHRINKIKSKAYHRIRKRQRLRKEENEQEVLREVDPEAAAAMDEKAAIARVQERMSLKHKNTSKWAKHVMAHGAAHQVETRKALAEQLQMGEDLRKRAGAGNNGSSVDDDDDEDDEDSDLDDETREANVRRRAADMIRGVLLSDEGGEQAAKGIMGMKFMRRAAEKQREKAREEMDAVLRELEQQQDEEEEEEEEEGGGQAQERRKDGEGPPVVVALMSNGGGAIQTPTVAWGGQGGRVVVSGPITITTTNGSSTHVASEASVELEAAAAFPEPTTGSMGAAVVSTGVLASFRKFIPAPSSKPQQAGPATAPAAAAAGGGGASNPWLEAPTVGKVDKRAASSSNSSKKIKKKQQMVVLSTEEAVADMAWEEDDDEQEDEEGEEGGARMEEGDGARVIIANTAEQQALVKRAFAAPDLDDDFAQDKAEQVAEEREEEEKKKGKKKGGGGSKGPQVAGWGCWAGMGAPAPMSQPPVDRRRKGGNKPPAAAAAPGGGGGGRGARMDKEAEKSSQTGGPSSSAAAETGDVLKPRTDDKLPTVLINERRIKQAARYKVGEVPYPFTSREQYERSLRQPVGKEWNTPLTVREATRAPVIVKPGTLVQPIKLRKKHRAVFGQQP